MISIEKYLSPYRRAFYASVSETLAVAFDQAWQIVQASHGPYRNEETAETTRAALASHIIGAALLGERNPRRLCDGAVAAVAKSERAADSAW